jgi:ATP-dependent protease HslVU (ClpYQ) peptidase subunit
MTCIVGIAEGGRVYIGGDSAGVSGWDLTVRGDSKVFRNGDVVMGFTSSFRMGQLLRYKFVPPTHDAAHGVEQYMVTAFVDAVRDCLKAGGYAKRENDAESGGVFLVGYRGHLFAIQADYQVANSADGYTAVGCGDQIARGALYATAGRPPMERVMVALEAAERCSAGVRAPFVVEVA